MSPRSLLLTAPCLLLFTTSLAAVELRGIVSSEADSQPIGRALVILRSPGRELRTVTDAQGAYNFNYLDSTPRYYLEVRAAGFRPFQRDNVRLGSDSVQLDAALPVAGMQESLVVSATAPRVEGNAAAVAQTFGGTELRDIPSATRSLTKFALLDPHVRNVVGTGGDGNNGSRLSINAGSYRHTSYVLDGIINYDWIYANGPYQPVSLGAIEQMQVIANQYSAEYGATTTGSVKVATRGGSNSLHGEAFALLRPSGIQAAPPLSIFRVPNARQQWGGSVGGPIARRPLFYFLNYEKVDQQRGAYIQSPSPSFFTGETDEHYALARIDYARNDHHALSLRINGYRYQNTNANDRVSGFAQPSHGRTERTQSWGGQFADRFHHAGISNEFRANYASYFPDGATPLISSVGINRPSYSTEGNSTSSWVHSRMTDLSDAASFTTGRHNVRFGVEATRVTAKDYTTTPLGTYTFAPGPPTAGEHPAQYAQTFGTSNITYGQTALNAFLQDDFRITSRLAGNLGLRYEYQSVTNDTLNLAPRAGLAWDVAGSGKTVIRAGAGVFYDQLYLYVYRRFYQLGATSPQRSYTIPYGTTGFPTFPNSLTAPPSGSSPALLNLFLPSANMLNPYSLQYSLGIERQLPDRFVLTVDGLYSHTLKQYRVNDINHPEPFPRTAPKQTRSGSAADATRPFKTYFNLPVRDIAVIENSSSSLYSALDFGIRRKFATRYNLEAHYVLSSSASYSMFYADANSGIPNEWNNWGSSERAPSDFYQRHRFAGSGTVDLLFGTRLGLVATLASGLPVNPLTGTDNNGDTYSADRPVGFGRNSFRGPKQVSMDLSLGKQFALTEHLRTELRTEVFNAFNRNNYITLNNVYGESGAPAANFMRPVAGINNVDPSRQIHFVLRFLF